jgi:hypothetical protein
MPGSTLRNMARGDRTRFFVDRRTKVTVIITGVILLIVMILLVAVVLVAVLAAGGDAAVVFLSAPAMFFELIFLYLFWMFWCTWMKRGKIPAYCRPARKSPIRLRQNVPARRSATKRQVRSQHKSTTRSRRNAPAQPSRPTHIQSTTKDSGVLPLGALVVFFFSSLAGVFFLWLYRALMPFGLSSNAIAFFMVILLVLFGTAVASGWSVIAHRRNW